MPEDNEVPAGDAEVTPTPAEVTDNAEVPATEAPADAVAADLAEVAQTPGALHTAAREGKQDAVASMIKKNADLEALDSEGMTALQVALAAGQADVAAILREAGAKEPPAPSAPPAPAAPEPLGDEVHDAPAAAKARPDALDELVGTPMDQVVDPFKKESAKATPKSMTMSAIGSYNDLKAKTSFAGATDKGVLKRATFMTSMSSFRSGPKYSLGQKGQNMFIRSSQTPAPGTYNLPSENKSKFKMEPRFSFGGNARFGMGENPSKQQPGPGHYDASDPMLNVTRKVGFGTSVRSRGNIASQSNPGPGAYENRSCMGQGLMFTAGGRHPTSYMRARSLPGPGAYNPSSSLVFPTQSKPGFGTSTRDDMGRAGVQPGPGTYEMQNFKGVGSDAPKFSATSRRKQTDLDSYLTPGPGTYNSHNTSFGY